MIEKTVVHGSRMPAFDPQETSRTTARHTTGVILGLVPRTHRAAIADRRYGPSRDISHRNQFILGRRCLQ
jgi:hypothetical protein